MSLYVHDVSGVVSEIISVLTFETDISGIGPKHIHQVFMLQIDACVHYGYDDLFFITAELFPAASGIGGYGLIRLCAAVVHPVSGGVYSIRRVILIKIAGVCIIKSVVIIVLIMDVAVWLNCFHIRVL